VIKPKKLIFWAIFLIGAYFMFGYVRMHTHGDVVAYKRFAKAVMKKDDYIARQVSVDRSGLAGKVLAQHEERMELFGDADIVFTYYTIDERRVSADGKTVYLSAEQVSRVNPEGYDTIWGEREVRIRQTVQMVERDGLWLVASFNDPVMEP